MGSSPPPPLSLTHAHHHCHYSTMAGSSSSAPTGGNHAVPLSLSLSLSAIHMAQGETLKGSIVIDLVLVHWTQQIEHLNGKRNRLFSCHRCIRIPTVLLGARTCFGDRIDIESLFLHQEHAALQASLVCDAMKRGIPLAVLDSPQVRLLRHFCKSREQLKSDSAIIPTSRRGRN